MTESKDLTTSQPAPRGRPTRWATYERECRLCEGTGVWTGPQTGEKRQCAACDGSGRRIVSVVFAREGEPQPEDEVRS